MRIDRQLYQKAFQAYLRKGTPIEWSIKQERPTTHYIWRTRRDGKVRSTHAAREGQVFSWNDPPQGGNPGEDYGCRCTAGHTCLKLPSLWKSHYRVFQAEVPRGVAGTSFAITIVATAEA